MTMFITAGLPLVQEKGNQISFNWRHDNSSELDVFDAATYFSSANEMHGASFTLERKMLRSGERMSLDIPMMSRKTSSNIPSPTRYQKSKQIVKKFKQTNSPGDKLASFFTSLFNQISYKKKTSYTQSMNGDQDLEIGRRKKRCSIILQIQSHHHFIHHPSTSVLKTPDAHTSIKNSSKDIQSHSDHTPNVRVISSNSSKMNNINIHVKPSCSSHKKMYANENTENFWLHEEKFKFSPSNERLLENYSNLVNGILGDKTDHSEDSTNFINGEDDGVDSDSTSDLFELKIFDMFSL